MNQLPKANTLHPEWDAPKDGDFARYVERLTAPHTVQLPEEPGRVLHAAESLQRARPRTAPAVSSELPDLHSLFKAPLTGMLNFAQLGLMLVVLVQVAVLALAGLGSFLGVAVAVVAWWVVGRWKRALSSAHTPSSPSASPLATLQQQLQALAQEKSKQPPRK